MAKNIPFKLILEKAKDYQADMTRFLRDMVAIPSESCDEKRVVHRIKEEMEKVGFDKVEIDPMGNVLGYIGHGVWWQWTLISIPSALATSKTGTSIRTKAWKLMS